MFGQILENLDKLWEWVKNISTLDYGALLKNFVAAVLIIVVCFLSTHLDMIASSPLFILAVVGIILLIFLIVQLISDTLKKMADKKEMASVSKRIICQEEIQHRLKDTLYKLNADRIFVIAKGRIIESGNHNELIALHGTYEKLYQAQFRTKEDVIESLEKEIE